MDVLGTAEGLGEAEGQVLKDWVEEDCGVNVLAPVPRVDGLDECVGDRVLEDDTLRERAALGLRREDGEALTLGAGVQENCVRVSVTPPVEPGRFVPAHPALAEFAGPVPAAMPVKKVGSQ